MGGQIKRSQDARLKLGIWLNRGMTSKLDLIKDNQLLSKVILLAEEMVETIDRGNKILVCGNGGSAADSSHLVGELLNQFCMGRTVSLPAIDLTAMSGSLTAISNDWGYEFCFSKQVQGLGKRGDLLLGITTSGSSKNIINAVEQADRKGMSTAVLTGRVGYSLSREYVPSMIIAVPSSDTPFIQEMHGIILHSLVYLVDWIRSGVDYLDKETW
jgi:D-sedoheptulose 7-phosphate isomerase